MEKLSGQLFQCLWDRPSRKKLESRMESQPLNFPAVWQCQLRVEYLVWERPGEQTRPRVTKCSTS
jgi:hypothetical protein